EGVVHGLDGAGQVQVTDDYGDPDLRRGDDLDVDTSVRERPEEPRRNARVRLHPGADQRHLADVVVVQGLLEADVAAHLVQRGTRRGAVRFREGERDVRAAGAGHRADLDDHVDVDVRVRARAEHRRRDAGPVGAADDRYLRLAVVMRDAADDGLFHEFSL